MAWSVMPVRHCLARSVSRQPVARTLRRPTYSDVEKWGTKKGPQANGCAAALSFLVMSSQVDAHAPWQTEPLSPARATRKAYSRILFTRRLLQSVYAACCAGKQFSIRPWRCQGRRVLIPLQGKFARTPGDVTSGGLDDRRQDRDRHGSAFQRWLVLAWDGAVRY